MRIKLSFLSRYGRIWHARRKVVHKQIYQSPLTVHHFVETFIGDLGQIKNNNKKTRVTGVPSGAQACFPPPTGRVKVNVDVAVGKNTGRESVAAFARDENRMFMGASTLVLSRRADAETLEALACHEACALSKDINARRIRVASDCKNVIANLEPGMMGWYAHVARDITKTKKHFEELVFCHESRRSNKEAHLLARSAVLDDFGRRLWLVEPPAGFCNSLFDV